MLDTLYNSTHVIQDVALEPLTEHKAYQRNTFGRYANLSGGPGYLVREYVIDGGAMIPEHHHENSSEYWMIVRGTAQLTIGEQQQLLQANEAAFIPVCTPHKIHNPGLQPFRAIVVQCGCYLGTDDVIIDE